LSIRQSLISQSNGLHKIAFPETGQAALSRRIALVRHAYVATMLEPQSSSDRVLPTDERQRKPTTPDHIVSLSRRLLKKVKDLRGQAAATAAEPSEISESALARRGERRRRVLVKAHSRFTMTTPATRPASLICPLCGRPLAYDRRPIGGVSDDQREQWDYYMCPACAPSTIVSADAGSVALTQCRNGQTQKSGTRECPALSGSVDNAALVRDFRLMLPPRSAVHAMIVS
jgi:hypothetical protein